MNASTVSKLPHVRVFDLLPILFPDHILGEKKVLWVQTRTGAQIRLKDSIKYQDKHT